MVWYSGDIISGINRKNVKLRMTGSVLTGPAEWSPYLQQAHSSLCMQPAELPKQSYQYLPQLHNEAY